LNRYGSIYGNHIGRALGSRRARASPGSGTHDRQSGFPLSIAFLAAAAVSFPPQPRRILK
jgi:hypothetical protein